MSLRTLYIPPCVSQDPVYASLCTLVGIPLLYPGRYPAVVPWWVCPACYHGGYVRHATLVGMYGMLPWWVCTPRYAPRWVCTPLYAPRWVYSFLPCYPGGYTPPYHTTRYPWWVYTLLPWSSLHTPGIPHHPARLRRLPRHCGQTLVARGESPGL